MAPQVGFEPTTDRLTADSSTTELLWNNYFSIEHYQLYQHDNTFSMANGHLLREIYTLLIKGGVLWRMGSQSSKRGWGAVRCWPSRYHGVSPSRFSGRSSTVS